MQKNCGYVSIHFMEDFAETPRFACLQIPTRARIEATQHDQIGIDSVKQINPDFHKKILFSNEARFWLNGYVNKQNCKDSLQVKN